MSIDAFLEHARRSGWEVLPPSAGGPRSALAGRMPDDLRRFLDRCGGVRCGDGIAVAQRVIPAQEAILGERYGDDPSAGWYVIAEDSEAGTAERVVIDLGPGRIGRCYEAFWDAFGIAGSMPVVARSFSDLLDRLRASEGSPYWSGADLGLGDAYD